MKKLFTITLLAATLCVKAQTKTDTLTRERLKSTYGMTYSWDGLHRNYTSQKPDTVQVIAFCLDTATLDTKFRKMYAIQGLNYPSFNMNGLTIYKQYLMPDRKTPSIYKVIYSITK